MPATVSPPGSAENYVDYDQFVDYQINRTRSGIKQIDLLTALVTVALAVTTYLLLFVVLDHWVIPGGFGTVSRITLLGALVVFTAGWVFWKIVRPYLRSVTSLYAARELEGTQPALKSSLLTLVDLQRAGRRVSPHIVSAMQKRAALRLSEMDPDQAVDRRPLMHLSYALFAVVLIGCLYTILSPKSIATSVWRALVPTSSAAVSTRTQIDAVDPGDATVLARSTMEVTVDLSGEIPDSVNLLVTTSDRSLVDEPFALRDTGDGLNRYRGVLAGPNGRGLLQDFRYRVSAGDAQSRDFHVTVQQAPYAEVEEVVYRYPAYMHLAERVQPGGEIDAWEGTEVTIRAQTNMPVAKATLHLHDTEDTSLRAREVPMEVTGGTSLAATLQLMFREDGTYAHFYRIAIETADGAVDPVPRLYGIMIRPDLPPELKLLHPSGDVEMPRNGVLPMAYEAADPDFMLRSVRMHFEHLEAPLPSKTRRLYEAPPDEERPQVRGTAQIDLSEFDVAVGDVLTFWLEARDNMAPLGLKLGNRTVTPRINITIVEPATPEEVEERLDQERREAQQRMEEAAQARTEQGEQAGDTETASDEGTEGDPMSTDASSETESQPANDAGGTESADNATTSDDAAERQDQATERAGTGEQETADTGNDAARDDQGGGQSADSERGTGDSGETGEAGADGEQSERSPEERAGDDEALERLLREYQEEIERNREATNESEQPANSDNAGNDPMSESGGGSDPQTSSDSTGGMGETNPMSDPSTPSGDPTSGASKPSPGAGDESQTGDSGLNETDSPSNAEPRPGEVGSDAATQPAENLQQPKETTGDSAGGERPASDPQANPTESRPGEQPSDPATQPTEQPSGQDPGTPPQQTGGSQQPGTGDPAQRTQQDSEAQPGDRGDSGSEPSDRPPARSEQQPGGPDTSDPGEGRRDGQRSEQPSTGEQGTSQQTSEGTTGGDQKGPGDATSNPGSQSTSDGSSGGQPGDQPGEGSTQQPGGKQPGGAGESESESMGDSGRGESGSESGGMGGESGMGGEGAGEGGMSGEGGGGESGGEGEQSSGGAASGETGGQPGEGMGGGGTPSGSGPTGTGGAGQDGANAPTSGGSPASSGELGAEPNDLRDKRRAAELVLKQLEDDLERGDVSPELLEDLGWTEDNLRDFRQRLEQRLSDTGDDSSPEAQAQRRQFEEILRGIDYSSQGDSRSGGTGPRTTAEGFAAPRRPAPSEFQRRQEAYKQRLSRESRGNP